MVHMWQKIDGPLVQEMLLILVGKLLHSHALFIEVRLIHRTIAPPGHGLLNLEGVQIETGGGQGRSFHRIQRPVASFVGLPIVLVADEHEGRDDDCEDGKDDQSYLHGGQSHVSEELGGWKEMECQC